ncbi:DNA polymerase III, epsilon subunit [Bifidobacterium actinocoloniiforme DSM 22766]|uniref:DNA polymerase III, epsilon subunit n=1 Tax=Bifidobacterium actinocoloniiforme DSM 22766 TaxID=1437605 RepID=A0A086Z0Z0_9BIFI|nr:exonuclease domain-containing protein [Bifidobacterium actinocoloniiforme]AKV55373.1 exonuclease [Bifidobacterium actinocoloniiforme DSM 22766]KFI40190.1 DNA polymerase III, epsilon subunit [Bifidobacterium actinocoloniiforme DSM 22766]
MSDTLTAFEQHLTAASQQDDQTSLAESWLLGLDTETTGVTPGKDAIVSACLILRNPALGFEGDMVAEWIINPHRSISSGASKVNGFTNEYLSEHGDEPMQAIGQIGRLIAQAQAKRIPLLAYNAPFDIQMLNGDITRWCEGELQPFETDSMLVVDPLVIDRAVSKRRGRRSLSYTCEYYGVVPRGNFHNAAADTIAAVDLVKPMTTLYPQVAHLTLGELMDWQRKAHADWCESYQRWAQARGNRRRMMNASWL